MIDDDEEVIEKVLLVKLMHLNAVLIGLIAGITLAIVIFLATIFLVLKDGPTVGQHLSLLNQYFFGYSVTFVGSLIGAAYGLAVGFIGGFAFAHLYNWIANALEKARPKK